MKILNLKISNILSIENADVTFGDKGLVLVEGYDYDTNRANGAGKSAIFNALSFALYDKLPRKITKSEIVRKGQKHGVSSVSLVAGGRTYKVRRSRPTAVEYFIDDKKVDMTQAEFEKHIGLNYEQFLITMYTAQDTASNFIDLNDTQKKSFILKVMNLNKFNDARDEISDKIKVLEQEKILSETKLQGYKSNIAIYKEQIVDPDSIKSQIEQLDKDIIAYNSEITKLQQIQEPDLSKYAELESKIHNQLMNIQSVRMLLTAKTNELNKLKNQSPDTSCPECNADLNIVNGHAHKAGNQEALDEQIKVVMTQIREYEADLLKEPEIKDLSKKIAEKKREEYKEFNAANSSMSEYRASINTKRTMIANLNTKLQNNEEIKEKAKAIISNAQDLASKIKKAEEDIEVLSTVKTIFDPTGAPAYVMDSIVDSFNERVAEYVSEIWPTATYTLQTYKTNKDKSVKAKFSETLTIDGKERSIGSLSGGEVRGLSLALDFAIIDVLSVQYGLEINPIILDEPFNGLDTVGREIVMDVLEKFSQNREIWVIDHSSEVKSMFSRVVRVEKRNGVSDIAG